MVKNPLSLASLALLLVWGSLHAAEPAGRVLLLQGSAVAVRGAQDVALARGSVIETGDLLRVAADSSLQVRFTDESVVALRANTQFKIDDYRFSDQGDGDKSFFTLLKGGMRTVTGLIGKRSPEAYQMRGITATIGVRGTHFTAVNCAADCTNADGSKADDGLYGGVSDGRIVVSNKAGESEFVRDQYFVVTSTDMMPKALLAPPAFLRDRLDGLAKARGKTAAGQAAEVALTGSGSSSTSETSSPIGGAVAGFQTALPANPYVPADTPRTVAVVTGTTAPTVGSQFLKFSEVSADNYKYVTTGPNPGSSQGVSTYAEQLQLDPTFSSSSSDWSELQTAGFSTIPDFYRAAYNDTSSATYDGITYNNVYNKTASTDVGFSAAAGNVSWGRFSEHEVQTGSNGSVTTSDRIQHWAFSNDIVTAAPTSGIFTYNPIGGTSPTDMNGNVGSMVNRGQWTVNFGAQTLATTQAISWSIAGSSYTVSVPTQTYQITTTNLGGSSTLQMVTGPSGGSLSSTTACSGGGCVSATTQLSVTPFGAQAQGMGAGLATTGVSASGATMQQSSSVQIYQR